MAAVQNRTAAPLQMPRRRGMVLGGWGLLTGLRSAAAAARGWLNPLLVDVTGLPAPHLSELCERLNPQREAGRLVLRLRGSVALVRIYRLRVRCKSPETRRFTSLQIRGLRSGLAHGEPTSGLNRLLLVPVSGIKTKPTSKPKLKNACCPRNIRSSADQHVLAMPRSVSVLSGNLTFYCRAGR
jgi:hypothetical protein